MIEFRSELADAFDGDGQPAPAETGWVNAEFSPDWCLRPGVTLREWREENGLNLGAAASACRMGMGLYRRIEDGLSEIDAAVAAALQEGTGTSAQFWLNLEHHYREGLAAGLKDVSPAPSSDPKAVSE